MTNNPNDLTVDDEARHKANTAAIVAAVALLLGLIACIWLIFESSNDYAPRNCDHNSSYMCHPETQTGTTTVQVPTTSMSPTQVPVPTKTPSEIVTTTVIPGG